MNRRTFTTFITAAGFGASALAAQNYKDRVAHIINLSPNIEITGMSFANRDDSRREQFVVDASWKNIGQQPVIAFELVILKYDPFNNRRLGSRWVVNGKNSIDWTPLAPGDFGNDGIISYTEEDVFTAIAYVRSARLADGTVWRVNEQDLLKELKKTAPKISDFGSLKPDPKEPAKKD